MCWRRGSGWGGPTQLALLPTSLLTPPLCTTNKVVPSSPIPPWCPPMGAAHLKAQSKEGIPSLRADLESG